MQKRSVAAPDAPAAAGGYAQAVEVEGARRFLFISGQVPIAADGTLPEGFRAQYSQAWRNVEAQLHAAAMGLDDLVKVTTLLADRGYAAENRRVRQEILGDQSPALTVVVAGIFDERWLVEIEAVAAA